MIILDTNALIYLIKDRIDLRKFTPEEIGVPTSAIKELEKLSAKDGNAKLALKLVDRFRVLEVQSLGDDGVIEAATKYRGSVITNDRILKERLKERNIRVTSVTIGMVRRF